MISRRARALYAALLVCVATVAPTAISIAHADTQTFQFANVPLGVSAGTISGTITVTYDDSPNAKVESVDITTTAATTVATAGVPSYDFKASHYTSPTSSYGRGEIPVTVKHVFDNLILMNLRGTTADLMLLYLKTSNNSFYSAQECQAVNDAQYGQVSRCRQTGSYPDGPGAAPAPILAPPSPQSTPAATDMNPDAQPDEPTPDNSDPGN
jgi:hypothetical protein